MSKTILVCDDHTALLGIIKHLLTKRGFKVITATNGEDGFELVRTAAPDLMLLDLAMPLLDGIGVLQKLNGMEGAKPYTLVLSGQESGEKRQEALSLGARELWKKPFNAAKLIARIEELVSQGAI